MRLRGKTILVTGAAGGIGQATCKRCAEEGASIYALDRPAAGGRDPLAATVELVGSVGGSAVAIPADVTDFPAMQHALAEIGAAAGRLDGLFVNAAINLPTPLLSDSGSNHDKVIDVNLDGAWNTMRAALPLMVASGGGSVVITSSIGAHRGPAGYASYAMSKHAMVGLMRTAARECGPHNIRVNTVHPTMVDTPMARVADEQAFQRLAEAYRARHALPVGWVEPVDIANAVLWLLSDEARYVSGIQLSVDAGYFA